MRYICANPDEFRLEALSCELEEMPRTQCQSPRRAASGEEVRAHWECDSDGAAASSSAGNADPSPPQTPEREVETANGAIHDERPSNSNHTRDEGVTATGAGCSENLFQAAWKRARR